MPQSTKAILLDIEGTTSSISFVYDVMFPYVRENVANFLEASWQEQAVRDCLPLLAEDLNRESDWLEGQSEADQQATVRDGVIELMDADVKATGLKKLQGLIWKSGFTGGKMVAHLYDEVADCIKKWNASNIDVRIYSSGSIQAQKLFFGHTVAGNLLDQLNGHYDTTIGPKQESTSYQKIAAEFQCEASEILFVSDVIAELEAAKSAGLQTVLSVRPGNKPVEPDHGFDSITTFEKIVVN